MRLRLLQMIVPQISRSMPCAKPYKERLPPASTGFRFAKKIWRRASLAGLVRQAVEDTRANGTRILVNDRLDVALAANAGGIHLGENSVPVEAVAQWRRSSGKKDFLIGASCHSLDGARAAERAGADYIFFGPVFATPSKAAYGPPQGWERLREVCASVKIPVLAIGGVTSENTRACLDAGAAGIAAIRLFQDAV